MLRCLLRRIVRLRHLPRGYHIKRELHFRAAAAEEAHGVVAVKQWRTHRGGARRRRKEVVHHPCQLAIAIIAVAPALRARRRDTRRAAPQTLAIVRPNIDVPRCSLRRSEPETSKERVGLEIGTPRVEKLSRRGVGRCKDVFGGACQMKW